MTNDGMISVNGNIENNLLITFQNTIEILLRQKQSYLSNIPGVVNAPFNGSVLGITRAGGVSLKEANERNGKLQYEQYLFDNRWVTKERWANSWIMDRKDLIDAITNPTSALYSAITDAVMKLKDKVILKASIAPVKVGGRTDSDPLREITAEEDGVKIIDATSGYNFDIIKRVKRNFGNNYACKNVYIIQTVNEETELLSDDKLINRDYIEALDNKHQEGSLMKSLGIRFISDFAGSDNGASGVGKKYDTVIPEIGGQRLCIALAERAVQFGLTQLDIRTESDLQGYVDSQAVKVIVRTHALRLQGEKVQIIKTTI